MSKTARDIAVTPCPKSLGAAATAIRPLYAARQCSVDGQGAGRLATFIACNVGGLASAPSRSGAADGLGRRAAALSDSRRSQMAPWGSARFPTGIWAVGIYRLWISPLRGECYQSMRDPRAERIAGPGSRVLKQARTIALIATSANPARFVRGLLRGGRHEAELCLRRDLHQRACLRGAP